MSSPKQQIYLTTFTIYCKIRTNCEQPVRWRNQTPIT